MSVSRRHVIGASAAAGALGISAGVAGTLGFSGRGSRAGAGSGPAPRQPDTTGVGGAQVEPFHGPHQAGVETLPQAHARFVALELLDGTRAADAVRMLRLLTDDAAALTQGRAPLADSEPELVANPARLTVTVGFGRNLVALAGTGPDVLPDWLAPLPGFSIDALDPARSRGDLLLQVCGDDPFVLSHAVRMLLKDTRAFARVAWVREGFRRAYGAQPQGTTLRNLFGQVDGTANPGPGSEDFARLVWGETLGLENPVFSARGEPPTDLAAHHPAWLRGGTTLAIRDIRMDLETWDEADRPAREFSVGRKLDSGAPLSGSDEFDVPDFEAKDALGLSRISPASHVARSRNEQDPAEQIYRRVYNYESAEVTADGAEPSAAGTVPVNRAGLVFASFQADLERQFLPIQRRLDQMDLLNQWTTPIGSTVWAVPPGVAEDEYLGETLFGS